MTLSANTLATELEKMVPTDDEAEAIDAFTSAFEIYFYEAAAGAIVVADESLVDATAALKGAMTGLNTDAALAMFTGITAFWGIVATAAADIFYDEVETAAPLGPAIAAIPPLVGLPALQAAITAAFVSNKEGKLDLSDSAAALASAIHSKQLGGICTFPAISLGGLGPLAIL